MITARVFLVSLLFAMLIPSVMAMEDVSKCETNADCVLGAFVYNNSYVPYTTQICNITIYYPNLTLTVDQATMQNNTNGYHNYTYTPTLEGYYPCFMWCFDSGDESRHTCSFVVKDTNTRVFLTDNAEIQATEDYEAQVIVIDSNEMVNADDAPYITIYSTNGSVAIAGAMAGLETGRYNYSFTTSDGDEAGVWKTVTVTTVNGRNYTNVEFWEIESNPAEVTIDVIDNVINEIVCRINITNEGTSSQEYTYRYWVTESPIGNYVDGKDSGMASKLISPGEFFVTDVILMLGDTGTHYCKADVYWGADYGGTEKSKASDQFTAVYSGGDYGGAEVCGSYTLMPEEPEVSITGVSGSRGRFKFKVWNGPEAQHFFMGTSLSLWEICELVGFPEYPTLAGGYAEFQLECTVQDAQVSGEAILTSDSGCYDTRDVVIGISDNWMEDLEHSVKLLFDGDIFALENDIGFGGDLSLPLWAIFVIIIVFIIVVIILLRWGND
jgi:hypothetical protein